MKKKNTLKIITVCVAGAAGLLLSLYKPGGILGFIVYMATMFGIMAVFMVINRRIK